MTEQESHEAHARHRVYAIMSRHQDAAFEELDKLHKDGIHDNDVIRALREGGYEDEADAYIEWADCLDPDSDVSNATTDPRGVTDPGTNPSDVQMHEALSGIRVTGSVSFGGPAIEFGRDRDGGQWVRPVGGAWVGVVEK